MITVQLCNPASQQPYDNFQNDTTRFVCYPDNALCQLHLQMAGSGEVKIEVDGDEIYQTPLDEETRVIPLTQILRLTAPRHPLAPTFLQGLRARLSDSPRATTAFSAVVTQDLPASVATVHFQLLSPEEYAEAFTRHLAKLRGPSSPAESARTWQAPQIQLTCWNCETPTPGTRCTKCGADQEE